MSVEPGNYYEPKIALREGPLVIERRYARLLEDPNWPASNRAARRAVHELLRVAGWQRQRATDAAKAKQ